MLWILLMIIVLIIGIIFSIYTGDFDHLLNSIGGAILLILPLMICVAIGQGLPATKLVSQEDIQLATLTTDNNINFTIKIEGKTITYYHKDLSQFQVTFDKNIKIITEDENEYLSIKEYENKSGFINFIFSTSKTVYEFHVLKDNILYIN